MPLRSIGNYFYIRYENIRMQKITRYYLGYRLNGFGIFILQSCRFRITYALCVLYNAKYIIFK